MGSFYAFSPGVVCFALTVAFGTIKIKAFGYYEKFKNPKVVYRANNRNKMDLAMLKRKQLCQKIVLEVLGIFICSHVMWLQSFNLAIVTLTFLIFSADNVPKVYNDKMLQYLM